MWWHPLVAFHAEQHLGVLVQVANKGRGPTPRRSAHEQQPHETALPAGLTPFGTGVLTGTSVGRLISPSACHLRDRRARSSLWPGRGRARSRSSTPWRTESPGAASPRFARAARGDAVALAPPSPRGPSAGVSSSTCARSEEHTSELQSRQYL